ncbi:MAG: DUF6485 family protein [bacterium]|nr:DUF6485 family protein [bacterium]
MECKIDRNRGICTCSYEPCARKGVCCDCLASHWRAGELPGCLFPPDIERTYDRSVERFVQTYRERGRWW